MKSRRGIVLKREDPNFEFLVTEYKYIKFKLNAKTSITFIFNIFEREGKDSTPLTRIEIDRFLKPDNASKIKINKEHGSAIPALGPEQLSVDHMLSINQRCMGGGMSQNYAALYFLEYYIKFFKFEYVIEFGTQKGALALYLANMAMVTEQFEFDTIDISDKDYYDRANEGVGYWLDRISNNAITARRVSIFKNDLFDPGFVKAIAATIKGIGKTLIIADNGDKPREYDTYTPVMKSGDHILLHDWEVEYRASQIVQVKNPQDFVMNRVQGWAEKAQELRTTFMPFEKYVY